jgi:hypothetical protein
VPPLNSAVRRLTTHLAMIGELIAQVVGEFLCYGTGRVVVSVFTPNICVSRSGANPWPSRRGRRWFALTYKQDGRRYYYDETVTFIGFLFWVALAIGIIAVVKNAHA